MNIGAKLLYDDVDYFCFHDVDLIPDSNVSYSMDQKTGCNKDIIHLCSYVIQNRNNFIKNKEFYFGMNFNKYFNLFKSRNFENGILGGVTLIKKEIWQDNKWNEIFQGWGAEDDEYYYRFNYLKKIDIYETNYRYISLSHKTNCKSNYKPNCISKYLQRFIRLKSFNIILNRYIYQVLKSLYKSNKKKKDFMIFDSPYTINSIVNENYTFVSVDFEPIKINNYYYVISLIFYFIKKTIHICFFTSLLYIIIIFMLHPLYFFCKFIIYNNFVL